MSQTNINTNLTSITCQQTFARIAGALWIALIFVLTALSLHTLKNGYRFDTNIMALLPQEEQSETLAKVQQVITQGRDQELVILIGSNDANSPKEQTLSAAKRAYTALMGSQLFSRIDGPQVHTRDTQNNSAISSRSFNFLSHASRQALTDKDSDLAQKALTKLFSPAGGIGNNLLSDPLGLFQQWQLSLLDNQPLTIEDEWLTLNRDDGHFRFIGLELKNSAFHPDYQQQVKNLIDHLRQQLNGDLELLSSGLIVHATHGAEQAKREISTIGLGSLLAITTILLIVFRGAMPIVYIFLPLVIGALFSFSICLLIFERIHLITLAFGTSLIGIAIDYSLHYVCAQRESKTSTTLPRIFSGLLLALISSVTAYIAQAAAPFPGLRQMAVFAALGLIGAWLTVVLVLPNIIKPSPTKGIEQVYASLIAAAVQRWSNIAGGKTKYLVAVIVMGVAGLATQVVMNDDLRALQTSPQHLIDNDIRISKLLSAESIGSYFVVRADSVQALLEKEEQLSDQLQILKSEMFIHGYIASSQFIPSITRQTKNHQLLRQKVYADGGTLSTMLRPTGMTQLEQAIRDEFKNYNFTPLTFEQWFDSSASQAIQNHWLGEIDGGYYSVVTLVGRIDVHASQKLASTAERDENIMFIDRPQSISRVLQNYRENLFGLLILAYALVTSLLLLRYRTAALDVIASPFIASLTVLAYLAISSNPLTVFHCLALLLVLGIGLDAAIFLKETQASPYTWLAVSLSSFTTLLAFGLLSFSQTPVLHFFGQTVAIGISAIWITAPFFCNPKESNNVQLQP